MWFAVFAFGCATLAEGPTTAAVPVLEEPAPDSGAASPDPTEEVSVSAQPPSALDPDALAAPPPSEAVEIVIHDPLADQVEAVLSLRAPKWEAESRRLVAEELARAEREDGLPALMLVALIAQESRFNPMAVGPRGSLGLLQIRPWVAAAVAHRYELPLRRSEQLHEPLINVRVGVAFLAEIHREFDDLELSLAAYHIGPTRVRRRAKQGWRPRGPYVKRVMGRYRELRLEAGELSSAVGG